MKKSVFSTFKLMPPSCSLMKSESSVPVGDPGKNLGDLMCGEATSEQTNDENVAMLETAMVCGVKRKLEEMEASSGTGGDERQSILNISMCKLQARRTQPSLHRSVLIYNTLKQIQHQLRVEGVCPDDHAGSKWERREAVPMERDHTLLDVPPSAQMDTSAPPLTSANADVSMESYEVQRLSTSVSDMLLTSDSISLSNISSFLDLDSCSLSAIASLPPTYNNSDSNDANISTTSINTTTSSSISLYGSVIPAAFITSSPLPATSLSLDALSQSNLAALSTVVSPHPSLTPLPNAASCTVSLTQLPSFSQSFGSGAAGSDIDLSVYDFDALCPLSPPSAKHVPLSAEELLCSTSLEPLRSLTQQPACPPQQQQPVRLKHESFMDDLDHVLQVLIGM